MDGPLPRRGPYGPPPPDFYPPRGPMPPSKHPLTPYYPQMYWVILTLCLPPQCGPLHPQEWCSLLVFLQVDPLFLHHILTWPPLFDSLLPPQSLPSPRANQVPQGRTPPPEDARRCWIWQLFFGGESVLFRSFDENGRTNGRHCSTCFFFKLLLFSTNQLWCLWGPFRCCSHSYQFGSKAASSPLLGTLPREPQTAACFASWTVWL